MPHIPPEPPHVPRFPPFRIPVGAIVLLVTIAALFPGMVLLLGPLIFLFVYLGALGSTVGWVLAGTAGIVFVLMVWKAPAALNRVGFPRPRLSWVLLLGATAVGVFQMVMLPGHSTFPFPVWLLPYVLVASVVAVLLWTRGFTPPDERDPHGTRNRWGSVILVLLVPVTSVAWGWTAAEARDRCVQEQLESAQPFTSGASDPRDGIVPGICVSAEPTSGIRPVTEGGYSVSIDELQ